MPLRRMHNSGPQLRLATSAGACLSLAMAIFVAGCAGKQAGSESDQPVSPSQQVAAAANETAKNWTLGSALIALGNAAGDMAQRRSAAQWLLLNAPASLAHEFEQTRLPSTREIILQTLADSDAALPDVFGNGLLEALTKNEGTMQNTIAQVLAHSTDSKMVQRIISMAVQNAQPLQSRRGAIMVLGNRPDKESITWLVRLSDPRQPVPIRDAATTALRQLLVTHGAQSNDLWQPLLASPRSAAGDRSGGGDPIQNFYEAMAATSRLMSKTSPLEQQLVEAQEQIYRMTAAPERPAMLVKLLSHPLDSVRRLGMKLVQQRLTDAQLPGPELIDELERRLGDTVPLIRERAAAVLLLANDETAAKNVAGSLARGTEKDAGVLNANLRLVARFPQKQAVAPALELLPEPALEAEAAGAIAAAQRKNLLTEEQRQIALGHLRNALALGRVPQPRMIQLLSLVGNDQDWQKIQSWLDHPDVKVKESAATVWMDSNKPVIELARRVADPAIGAIALQAATTHGDDVQSFAIIVDLRPGQDVIIESWRRCLIAMSARVAPAAVLTADQRLTARGEPASLREAMLTAAITRIDHDPSQRNLLADLYIARAEVRLASDPTSAAADLRQTNALNDVMNPSQLRRRDVSLVHTRLVTGDVNGALELAKTLLTPGTNQTTESLAERSNLLERFVLVAERSRAATPPQTEQARSMGVRLRDMLQPTDTPEFRRRIDALAELPAATSPATAPAAPASTTPAVPTTNR